VTWPQIAVHHEFITDQLKAGVTQATIHQRLTASAGWQPRIAANVAEEAAARRTQGDWSAARTNDHVATISY
jgi:hypothetical protein